MKVNLTVDCILPFLDASRADAELLVGKLKEYGASYEDFSYFELYEAPEPLGSVSVAAWSRGAVYMRASTPSGMWSQSPEAMFSSVHGSAAMQLTGSTPRRSLRRNFRRTGTTRAKTRSSLA